MKRIAARLAPYEYIEGILRGDRTLLARAVTVLESDLESDSEIASEILNAILPYTGNARRVGVTGTPGAGKSTLIDRLGMHLIRDRGEKVAVLTIDPSSPISGGSILGDKTRMENLVTEEAAFIRPSPARGHLGAWPAALAKRCCCAKQPDIRMCWSRRLASASRRRRCVP